MKLFRFALIALFGASAPAQITIEQDLGNAYEQNYTVRNNNCLACMPQRVTVAPGLSSPLQDQYQIRTSPSANPIDVTVQKSPSEYYRQQQNEQYLLPPPTRRGLDWTIPMRGIAPSFTPMTGTIMQMQQMQMQNQMLEMDIQRMRMERQAREATLDAEMADHVRIWAEKNKAAEDQKLSNFINSFRACVHIKDKARFDECMLLTKAPSPSEQIPSRSTETNGP